MATEKIKISELPEVTSVEGVSTIGVDKNNRSVRVSLELAIKGDPGTRGPVGGIGPRGTGGPAGAPGGDGKEGKGIEFVFKRQNSATAPTTPATSQVVDYIPKGWTVSPSSVTSSSRYEFISMRTKVNGVWGNFSTPKLCANYSVGGGKGDKGDDGVDGKGIEVIFRSHNALSVPPLTINSGFDNTVDNYLPDGWTASPSGVSSSSRYEFTSIRTKVNGRWQNFSEPKLCANYSVDGAPGARGDAVYIDWAQVAIGPLEDIISGWNTGTLVNLCLAGTPPPMFFYSLPTTINDGWVIPVYVILGNYEKGVSNPPMTFCTEFVETLGYKSISGNSAFTSFRFKYNGEDAEITSFGKLSYTQPVTWANNTK